MKKIFATGVALAMILMSVILTGCNGNVKELTDEQIAYNYVVAEYGEGDYKIEIDDVWTSDERISFRVIENGRHAYTITGPRTDFTK